ncbi:helix-turn-helix domain-containing protein [Ferruginibacter sp. SUN106]|uniref:helix-turn-helix domain-containing protein n=1 Tax=Ferruginibacter sp. SUN106 TaxID=2978348 RepID=UPI003D367FA5
MQNSEIFQSTSAQEFFRELRHELYNMQRPPDQVILDEVDFCNFLKISKRHACDLRVEGQITYSKIGGKLYYKLSDILNFIERHQVKSVAQSIRLFKNT